MNAIPAYEIWKAGIPLSEAAFHFAPEKLRAEYDAPKMTPPGRVSRGFAMMADQFPDRKEQILAAAQRAQAEWDCIKARSTAAERLRDLLLHDLRSEKLVAYGFQIPRKRNAIPALIPIDLFRSEFVDWARSSLKGAGREFVSVTMLPRKSADKIVRQSSKKPAPRTKRGPVSSANAIAAAVQSLKGGQLRGNLQKQNIAIVRARIHELFPGDFPKDRGLSKESIRKVLAQLIPRDK